MKNRSRLAVLLAAVLLSVTLLAGLTAQAAVVGELNSPKGVWDEAVSEDVVQANMLYEELMACTTMQEMYSAVFNQENWDNMWLLNETQLNEVYSYLQKIYTPETDGADYFEMLCDAFVMVAEGNGMMLLAGSGTASGTMTGTEFMARRDQGNCVVLGGNVTLEDHDITVESGDGLIINLNGYALIGTGKNSVITNKGNLQVIDSNPNATHKGSMQTIEIYRSWRPEWPNNGNGSIVNEANTIKKETRQLWKYDGKGNVTVTGGIITGGRASNGGGVNNQGTFEFKGGTIIGCHAYRPEYGGNGHGGGIYNNGETASLIINGGKIKGNRGDSTGGGLTNDAGASGEMIAGLVADNRTTQSGGGINVVGKSEFTLRGGQISSNFAEDYTMTGNGGGIHVQGAVLNYYSGSITNNSAQNCGGGIYVYQGGNLNAEGEGAVISYNEALDGSGGGVMIQYGDVILKDCQIIGNTSTEQGGGIYLRVGIGEFTNVTVKGNKATGSTSDGGAINISSQNNIKPHHDSGSRSCSATIIGGVYEDNYAARDGGAVYISVKNSTAECNVNITGGVFKNNEAYRNGGGLYIEGAEVNVSETATNKLSILDNKAITGNGGALYLADMYTNGAYDEYISETETPTYSLHTPINFSISGGTVENNTAKLDGGAVYIKGGENIKIGTLDCNNNHAHPVFNNNTAANGGAFAVNGGSPQLNCGSFSNNYALNFGGAIYVSGGSLTMDKGTVTGNGINSEGTTVTRSGGAIYISNGSFFMNDGTISTNRAETHGGAIYLSGGNFTMNHGTVSNNAAINGGAVYVNGGDFTMKSGTLSDNTALTSDMAAAEAGSQGYGGAVFANGGDVTVGLLNCTQENSLHVTPCHHPKIENNEAVFGGGFAVRGGTVTFYCCDMRDNIADPDSTSEDGRQGDRGKGMNVYMDDLNQSAGTIHHHYQGANIGEETDHGMVSVGGDLIVEGFSSTVKIKMRYISNGVIVEHEMEGTAFEGYYLNLPFCPKAWQKEEEEYTFVGWTHEVVDADTDVTKIRKEADYDAIGEPVEIKDLTGKDEIFFYGVWAPNENGITYAYTMDGENVEAWNNENDFVLGADSPSIYNYTRFNQTMPVPEPSKAGYAFKGWKMYASMDKISNWDADPSAVPVTKVELLPDLVWNETIATDGLNIAKKFGDIVLVAVFEPAFSGLRIIKTVPENTVVDQDFFFKISGHPSNPAYEWTDMLVSIQGAGSQMIYLPVGTYTVKELESWSWRYAVTDITEEAKEMPMIRLMTANEPEESAAKQITITDPQYGVELTFTNTRIEEKWLDDSGIVQNELSNKE